MCVFIVLLVILVFLFVLFLIIIKFILILFNFTQHSIHLAINLTINLLIFYHVELADTAPILPLLLKFPPFFLFSMENPHLLLIILIGIGQNSIIILDPSGSNFKEQPKNKGQKETTQEHITLLQIKPRIKATSNNKQIGQHQIKMIDSNRDNPKIILNQGMYLPQMPSQHPCTQHKQNNNPCKHNNKHSKLPQLNLLLINNNYSNFCYI